MSACPRSRLVRAGGPNEFMPQIQMSARLRFRWVHHLCKRLLSGRAKALICCSPVVVDPCLPKDCPSCIAHHSRCLWKWEVCAHQEEGGKIVFLQLPRRKEIQLVPKALEGVAHFLDEEGVFPSMRSLVGLPLALAVERLD
eukprot:1155897-Pelagomonas_calceolata.AAC.5